MLAIELYTRATVIREDLARINNALIRLADSLDDHTKLNDLDNASHLLKQAAHAVQRIGQLPLETALRFSVIERENCERVGKERP
jgi:hypothetical protein